MVVVVAVYIGLSGPEGAAVGVEPGTGEAAEALGSSLMRGWRGGCDCEVKDEGGSTAACTDTGAGVDGVSSDGASCVGNAAGIDAGACTCSCACSGTDTGAVTVACAGI